MTQPLTIYKASAGSGKTFTLAVEYIKLLINDPQNYRYTLAVTFTNKATEEMKSRILSKLYALANKLPDADDYMDILRSHFPSMTDDAIRCRAEEALQSLMHNYHYFRVETIDSFFQSILRNLARELGLAGNLSVGLNNHEVEQQAVDNIIAGIENDHDPLLTWIMDSVSERISDSKSWDVITGLKKFGQAIFADFYKSHLPEMNRIMAHPEFFGDYKKQLLKKRAQAYADMADKAKQYHAICSAAGLTDACFHQSSKSASAYFKRLETGAFMDGKGPNSYVLPALTTPSALVSKKASTAEATAIVTQVVPLIASAEALRTQCITTIHSVDLTVAHISELRLLNRIQQEVSAINDATGNFLLSDTQQLLHDLIDGQDAPFIYEKTGAQLHFIMIDEFQDTSAVQWENFKILLDDCMAHSNGSLIVGDVKQSIYRWRGGDWRLLQDLSDGKDSLVAGKTSSFAKKTLGVNYRSQRNIVYFNNAFFTAAARITQQQATDDLTAQGASPARKTEAEAITKAYADVCQNVPEKRSNEGLVSIRMLPQDDYEQMMIREVKAIVEQLLEQGTPPETIAILVRKNSFITQLAEWFQQNPITVNGKEVWVPMVSDEAFRLDASQAVCTIITAMHVLAHPDDNLATATLAKAYQNITHRKEGPAATDSHLFVGQDDLRPLLPSDMTQHWDELLAMPLIDLAERLYSAFELARLDGQSAYMCAFFDQMAKYLQRHVASIDDFLDEWQAHMCSKAIHGDAPGGVRLLTIHKSKGLEYDHVIIPWCDWALEDNKDMLWVEPREEPYNELPIASLDLSAQKLLHSVYKDDYQGEHTKNIVDNLNVLYVAFTRAARNLFVVGRKKSDKNSKQQWPSQTLEATLKPLTDGTSKDCSERLHGCMETAEREDGATTYTYGTFSPSVAEDKTATANIFEQTEQPLHIDIRNYDSRAHFVQSYDSSNFILTPEERQQADKRQTYIDTGNILHTLFASIYTLSDLDRAISQLEFDGVLYDEAITRDDLRATIANRLQSEEVKQWFDPRWTVFNECTILTYDPESQTLVEKRPDRVIYDGTQMIVIDFKTGAERPEHKRQVTEYMSLLRQMGYDNVSGYLWYILTNHVLPV